MKDGYDYIGTKDVGFDQKIDYNNGVRIPFDEPKFKYAEAGTPLLCIEGGSAGRKIGLLDRKVCFGNKLCAFTPLNIDSKYLFYYLQSPQFLGSFNNNMSGIIGGVSIKNIKKITMLLPPPDEQKHIAEKLDQLLPLCDDIAELT